MALTYIKCFYDLRKSLSALNHEEIGRSFMALLEYAETGAIPQTLTGNERFLFPSLSAQIDRDKEAYAKRCAQNSDNQQKRWEKERMFKSWNRDL